MLDMARPPATRMGSTPSIATLSLASLVLAAFCSFASAFAFAPSFRSGTWVQHHNAAARRHAAAAGTAAGAAAAAGTTGAPTTMVAAEPVAGLLKTVTVELEDRSYPIYIGEGILDRCVRLNLRPRCSLLLHGHRRHARGCSMYCCRIAPQRKQRYSRLISCARLACLLSQYSRLVLG